MNSLIRGAGMALALLVLGSVAVADPILRIDDLGTAGIDVTVLDNGVGDANPLVGIIVFNGSVGSWMVNVATGISKPVLGPNPKTDLNSVNVSGGAGTIQVSFSDTGFTWPWDPAQILVDIGGTTDGSVSYEAKADAANVAFGGVVGASGTFSGGAFSETTGFLAPVGQPFSLTSVLTIKHTTGVNVSSADLELQATPEPGSLALMGLALVGGLIWRRRRSA